MRALYLIALLPALACSTPSPREDVPAPDPGSGPAPALRIAGDRTFAWTGDWIGDLSGRGGETILLRPGAGSGLPPERAEPVSGRLSASGSPPRLRARYSLEAAPPGRYFVVTTLLYRGPAAEDAAYVRGTTLFTELEVEAADEGEKVLPPREAR